MAGIFYLDTSFIIASILNTKNKHYHENFVTLNEINITKIYCKKNLLKKE